MKHNMRILLRSIVVVNLLILMLYDCQGQFTRSDSLRGSITPQREWWDLTYYHLDITVDPDKRWIEGKNTIEFTAIASDSVVQIDLQPPLRMHEAFYQDVPLAIFQEGHAHFIHLPKKLQKGAKARVTVTYSGHPQIAIRPPWDGGLTFQKDSNDNHFVATSCQGLGASIWWPCKDHMYDEPDSMLMSITVPGNLMDVSNGVLRGVESHDDTTKTYHWFVSNPINNYGVNINIADYAHWSETYDGENGPLKLDYYPLKINEHKARTHWKDVRRTIEAFEYWFGPYPFYEDGYKLVETPYLGMEHQSSVTYGNGYQNGYLGTDLSNTGHGLLFDFIIIHESGHERFANNITYKDMADMWIHEGFTTYSEGLFLEYHYSKEIGDEYLRGLRSRISNSMPMVGAYHVNKRSDGDMYPKGANMLHTLRQVVNDDDKWREMLRGLNKEFYHQTVTTKEIENYISDVLDLDLVSFFDQYLRDSRVPVLEYIVSGQYISYRWNEVVPGFRMPVFVNINGKNIVLKATDQWQHLQKKEQLDHVEVNPNFYVRQQRLR